VLQLPYCTSWQRIVTLLPCCYVSMTMRAFVMGRDADGEGSESDPTRRQPSPPVLPIPFNLNLTQWLSASLLAPLSAASDCVLLCHPVWRSPAPPPASSAALSLRVKSSITNLARSLQPPVFHTARPNQLFLYPRPESLFGLLSVAALLRVNHRRNDPKIPYSLVFPV
jgi:hypothetical protein